MVDTFNPKTWEAETGGSQEFRDSQEYTEEPILEKKQVIFTPEFVFANSSLSFPEAAPFLEFMGRVK